MTKRASDSVPADPSQWSESSQRSVAAGWTTEYTSRRYTCWHCRADAVFTAADQKYTYEVKKAPIDQQRILCESCWKRLNAIDDELAGCSQALVARKAELRVDRSFLERWAALLKERDGYVPYKSDVARKNMIAKLLSEL
jgi:hypothetical protein